MQNTQFQVEFHGTRGSTSAFSPDKLKYGSNTSCVAVNIDNKYYVFDAGTGIANLGKSMYAKNADKDINLFLSHYHYDHIEGLPFFKYSFMKGASIHIFGQDISENGKADTLQGIFRRPAFPVHFLEGESPSKFSFHNVQNGAVINLDNKVSVSALDIKHAGDCKAYRLSYENLSFVYMTDMEAVEEPEIQRAAAFARDSDVLVLDAFFPEDRYESGWGHLSWEQALDIGIRAKAKTIVLSHHHNDSSDELLDRLYEKYRKKLDNFILAKDNMILNI